MWFFGGSKDKKCDKCGPNCKCSKCTGKCDKCEKCDMKSDKCKMEMGADGKSKPKPCCVCLDQKEARDKCLLLKGDNSPDCAELVAAYKKCMAGYGFTI